MNGRVVPDDPRGRARAIEILRAGGLVALPTDTVYGLAVSLGTPGGLERLFAAKRRPVEKAVMLLLADAAQAGEVGIVDAGAAALANVFWPGGLSLVLARRPGVELPALLTAGTPTVGVRLPDHPCPRALAAALRPLPTSSANVSGHPEAQDAAGVLAQLGDAVDLVIDGGPARGGTASTVVDCSVDPARILREGAVPRARVEAVLAGAGRAIAAADVGP